MQGMQCPRFENTSTLSMQQYQELLRGSTTVEITLLLLLLLFMNVPVMSKQ